MIDAKSEEDVRLLATCFMTTPQEDRWKLLAKVFELGLMKFSGATWALWIAKKWKGVSGIYLFFHLMSQKSQEAIDNWMEDVIRHIVNGADEEDVSSVGGWSQREIDLLLSEVNFSALASKKEESFERYENEV